MKKNKPQTSQSFPTHLSLPPAPIPAGIPLPLFICFSPLISSTPPCLSQKDTPRAFGASLRRHAAP